jgi:hypothetical protein
MTALKTARRPVPPIGDATPLAFSEMEYLWNLHIGPGPRGTADPEGLIQRLIVNLNAALTPAPLGIGSFVIVTGTALDTLSATGPSFTRAKGLVVDTYTDGDWYVYLFDEQEGYKFLTSALTVDPRGHV